MGVESPSDTGATMPGASWKAEVPAMLDDGATYGFYFADVPAMPGAAQ